MNIRQNSKNMSTLLIIVSVTLLLQFCASPQKQAPPAEPTKVMEATGAGVTYANDIQVIMKNSCTPCHFPEKGKKELLNTYEATVKHIDDIIFRIELPADSSEFMPFKSKKPALTADEVSLFKQWRDEGLIR